MTRLWTFVSCIAWAACVQGADPGPAPTPPLARAADLIHEQEKPRVSPRVMDLATEDNTSLYISLSNQRAYLFVGEEVAIDTPISSGKRKGMTRPGTFRVLEKKVDHQASSYGEFVNEAGDVVRSGVSTRIDSAPSGTRFRPVPMKFFIRVTEDGAGLHAGLLPGYPAADGSIRVPPDVAPLIYHKVKPGTPVTIEE